MRLAVGCTLLLLVISLAAVAQTSDVDWVHGTDFNKFHTFTWATAAYPIQDSDANLGMAQAVQDELSGKGVQFVGPQDKFDIFVTYNAKITTDVNDSSKRVLTLKVLIFDSSNNNVIWRSGGYIGLSNDKSQNRANARALLDDMFSKYPPE